LGALALIALLAVLADLNIAGLRDRLAAIVGASVSRRTAPLPKIQSIAVLPLENLSGDKDQEYFADGMTEALITDLGKISALRVISRTSVMHYKGTAKTLPEIARELNVDAVVEGAMMRSGDRVRITAQLIQAATDKHLWAETYERDLRDVLVLQSEVAQAIAREVQVKLTPQEQARFVRARPVNPEAYEFYLRGLFFWEKRTEEDLKKAIGFFEEAAAIDPGYARAYAGIAYCYPPLAALGYMSFEETATKTRAAAMRALELDDSLAETHTARAAAANLEWDWPKAESEYKRAIELNPNYATAHFWYGHTLEGMGRFEEGLREKQRAHELDPLNLTITCGLGIALDITGRPEQAKELYLKALELDSSFPMAHGYLGLFLEEQGRYQEAVAEFGKAGQKDSLGHVYALSGKQREAQEILQELKKLSKRRYVSPFGVAIVYTGLGDKEQAFNGLEKAYQAHDQRLIYLKVDPRLKPLRSAPRFQDLLRRMNFPP